MYTQYNKLSQAFTYMTKPAIKVNQANNPQIKTSWKGLDTINGIIWMNEHSQLHQIICGLRSLNSVNYNDRQKQFIMQPSL